MVRGALCGTLCNRYHIVTNKEIYLQGLNHSYTGSTAHMSRFGQKGDPVVVKVGRIVNKKTENLARGLLF